MENTGFQIRIPKDGIHVKKENGTEVYYHIFPEYEVHLNVIPPHSLQEWHYHTQIQETILMTRGEMVCRWVEDGSEKSRIIREKDLVQTGCAVHTFANEGDRPAEFAVFRFVPDGTDKRQLIKSDKTVVPGPDGSEVT